MVWFISPTFGVFGEVWYWVLVSSHPQLTAEFSELFHLPETNSCPHLQTVSPKLLSNFHSSKTFVLQSRATMSNTPGEDPSSVPFQPSQPLGSPHTTSRERGLYTFVRGMMNRSVDEGDRAFAVLTSLDPSNLLAMCQRSLGEYTVEKKSTSVRFTHLGFEQSLVLGLTPKAGSSSSDDPAAPAPMPLVELRVLQCDSCDNAAKAFTNYVGLFQRTWSDVIKRTRNRGLGDYASETDTSIFWTQLSAFVVLEILPEHPKDMSPGEGSIGESETPTLGSGDRLVYSVR